MTKYLTSASVCAILMVFVSMFNIWACVYMVVHKNPLWILFMFYVVWGIVLIVKFFNYWKKKLARQEKQEQQRKWDEFANAWKTEMRKEQEKWN